MYMTHMTYEVYIPINLLDMQNVSHFGNIKNELDGTTTNHQGYRGGRGNTN